MSLHINAKPGDIAPNILMPGDPLRAKYIADTFLEDAFCFNELRGMYGYTGTYKGHRVSVMASGMGTPSLMIYMTELCREYGCKNFVRVGTAGAVREELEINDIVLSTATSTTSGINLYDLPGTFAPAADFELLHNAYHAAQKEDCRVYVGTTLCNDHFYVADKANYSRQWEKWQVLAAEQEGVGLYSVAAREGVKALMILNIVANLYKPEKHMSAEEKERGLDKMIRIGLETLISTKV